eukprot:6174084-Pleurochrysis_carterae.AAC.1
MSTARLRSREGKRKTSTRRTTRGLKTQKCTSSKLMPSPTTESHTHGASWAKVKMTLLVLTSKCPQAGHAEDLHKSCETCSTQHLNTGDPFNTQMC